MSTWIGRLILGRCQNGRYYVNADIVKNIFFALFILKLNKNWLDIKKTMAKVQYLIQKKKFPFLIYKGRQGTNNMCWKTISYLELNILFPFQIMIFYLLKVFNQIKIYVRQRLVLARFDEINYLILVKFLVHCDKP